MIPHFLKCEKRGWQNYDQAPLDIYHRSDIQWQENLLAMPPLQSVKWQVKRPGMLGPWAIQWEARKRGRVPKVLLLTSPIWSPLHRFREIPANRMAGILTRRPGLREGYVWAGMWVRPVRSWNTSSSLLWVTCFDKRSRHLSGHGCPFILFH